VTAVSGYVVSSVTGCGVTLSGTTYTTGAVSANYTVTASFATVLYQVTGTAGTGGQAQHSRSGVQPASASDGEVRSCRADATGAYQRNECALTRDQI